MKYTSGLANVAMKSVLWAFLCTKVWALDINLANEAELDSLKGMGPALSRHLLKARAEGEFQDWSDVLQRVSGLGLAKAKQFSAQGLTVNGQAFTQGHALQRVPSNARTEHQPKH